MKNKLLKLLIAVLSLGLLMFFVTACGHQHAFKAEILEPTCTEKGFTTISCDCGAVVVGNNVDPLGHSFTNYISDGNATYDTDGTKTATCDREGCEEKDTVIDVGSKIINFKTLFTDGRNVKNIDKFANAVNEFSFAEEIEIKGDGSYVVSKDQNKIECYANKIVPLNEGLNVFYVFVELDNQEFAYSVELYRNKIFTVSFNLGNGNSIENQVIEEGGFVTKPKDTERIGYIFFGWDYDFTSPITAPTEISAKYKLVDGLEFFTFTSTSTTCEITELNDKTLTEIQIPDCVTSIGRRAFESCDNLETVKFGANSQLKSIGASAFYYCTSLESIEIPNSVTSMGDGAFCECENLKTVIFGEDGKLTSISPYVFNRCTSLESIELSSNIINIDEESFARCYKLKTVKFDTNSKLKNIGVGAFTFCDSLESVEIPTSVTNIGRYAFTYCTNLKSVEISNNVTSIGDGAFLGCDSLESIILPFVGATLNGTSNSHFGYIFGASRYDDNYDCVPTSLKTVVITGSGSIGESAFYNCSSLTSIEIPDSVTNIGYGAFSGCENLDYNIKDGLKYLGNDNNKYLYLADTESTGIKSVSIDADCKYIGASAFYNCVSLESVEIPGNVTTIDKDAFYGCTSLTKANYTGTIDQWAQITFKNMSSNPLYITKNLYINDVLVTEVKLTTATKISSYAFYYCTSVKSIEIPNSVKTIGEWAFFACSQTSIMIPNSVTSIGEYAFQYCDDLTVVTFEDGCRLTNLSSQVFAYCTKLKTVKFGANSQLKILWHNVFQGCSLTSIEIPNSVMRIGNYAFSSCDDLETVYYRGTVTEWRGITIGSSNTALTNATIYYYVENESDVPTDGGNYWHYVDGVPTKWE